MDRVSKAELITFASQQVGSFTTPDGRTFQLVNGVGGTNDPLSVPAFYSGTRFLSETLAGLPKHVYQKKENTRKKVDHYVNEFMSDEANEIVNSFYLWETAFGHAAMYGNGYVWCPKRNGKVVGMYNLHALMVVPFRSKDGKQWFVLRDDKGKRLTDEKNTKVPPIPRSDMIHIRNFSEDGETGVSVVDKLAETLALPQRLDEFLNNYFEKGAAVNLVIEAEGDLDNTDIDTLRYSIEQNHKGVDKAHETMVLANAKAKTLTSPLKEFALEIVKAASIDDIARVLRVPPTTLYALGRATWGNLEQLGTELVKYSFTPWVIKAELECKRVLLSDQDKASGHYIKWNLEGLQRGDYATRVEAGVKLTSNRLMTPNEWRALEDLEPYEGGDEFYGPLNTPGVAESDEKVADESEPIKEKETPTEAPEASTEQTVETSKTNLVEQYGRFIEDAKQRVTTKQTKAFSNASKKEGAAYDEWLNRFAGEQGIYLGEALDPFLSTVIADKVDLAFALQTVVEDYTQLVLKDKENADPQAVINKVIERVK